MPLYEYRCSKCQRITEIQARIDDAPPFGCSHCGQMGAPLHKILSRVAPGKRRSEDHHSEDAAHHAESEETATESASPAKPGHSCGGGCSH